MGGCCCCASKRTELNRLPAYFHYPISEESVPLSSHLVTVSALSTGLLVDTNLDTSVPDTYRAPPAPIPFESHVVAPHIPSSHQENSDYKSEVALQTTNAVLVGDTNPSGTLKTKLKNLEADKNEEINIELSVSKATKDEHEEELKKSKYDSENPKIITKCDHHFHLACILEWMERSDTCPVCDQEMIFSPTGG